MRAIVLSGGGAKGAYQVGVWKALRKLHIKYEIVTGTSIGALNGMMMAQHEYYKCLDLWCTINLDKLYDNFDNNNMYKSYFSKVIEGGIDTYKIKKIINDIYNSKKLYKCKYGVVSVNLSNKKVVYSTTDNTASDKLSQYILASSTCFPFFKPTEVDESLFIDGGYYDNLPINLAIDLGASEIIAVDLRAIGIKQRTKKGNVKITYITPNNKLDSFLKFERISAVKMIRLGYNDTMKMYKELEGKVYTFKLGSLDYNYKKYCNDFEILCFKYFGKSKKIKLDFVNAIEESLVIFDIEPSKIYGKADFHRILLKKFHEHYDQEIKNINIKEIKKVFNRKTIVKNIYKRLLNKEDVTFFKIFKKEFLVAFYLILIGR